MSGLKRSQGKRRLQLRLWGGTGTWELSLRTLQIFRTQTLQFLRSPRNLQTKKKLFTLRHLAAR